MSSLSAADPGAIPTPMMGQYLEIKAANPGFLLFYRMGDFYEMFFEDAEIASGALGIVLTRRGKHLGQDIPMCGVPVHAAQDYLRKLIGLGHRVAICEQVEDPAEARKRGGKSPVKRDVVRLVTRGTITEDELLPAGRNNFIAALAMLRHGDSDFALAYADISTGELRLLELGADALTDELARLGPAELLLTETTSAALQALRVAVPQGALQTVSATMFDSEAATEAIRLAFPPAMVDPSAWSRTGRSALGALIAYVGSSQKGAPVALRAPVTERPGAFMAIDAASRESLELLESQGGGKRGSLRQEIDLCVTPGGSRLLAQRLAAPLRNASEINRRLDAVADLAADTARLGRLRLLLKRMPDVSRALIRLALGRGAPRDLLAVGRALAGAAEVREALADVESCPALMELAEALHAAPVGLGRTLVDALEAEPPVLARDGGFVARGFDARLDAERALATETRTVVAALQSRLIAASDVKSLRIRHNNVLGYFVEVPAAHGIRLLEEPHRQSFIHRQTLASAMRFTTAELAELEGRIAKANEAAIEIEAQIFASLCAAVLAEADALRALADALAELDLHAALAQLALTRNWSRPVVDETLSFRVEAGRHPVVEPALQAGGGVFVANDTDLGDGALWLITGPNMGGKSTFLRQNALLAILAQTGSFVPAASAHIGVVDRLFSRVGASDDIARGRSTFMVEMVETATILNRATARSLVILDEIGRGTATFDGLSIAWATAEALHEQTGCRTLFATHFHEMTALAKTLPRLSNHTMRVREWEGDVVFLHEVAPGAADRSYGIQVARLAGLPESVLGRARQVLRVLEQRSSGGGGAVIDDLPLFAHRPVPEKVSVNPIHEMLESIRPDELTPRQAIDLIYELKNIFNAARRN